MEDFWFGSSWFKMTVLHDRIQFLFCFVSFGTIIDTKHDKRNSIDKNVEKFEYDRH